MASNSQRPFQLGTWQVDPALDTISRGNQTLKLEPRMRRLLMFLAGSPGAGISQDRLLAEVWAGVVVGPASVYQAVSQLRRLLGDTDPEPTYIATVPRKGYRLVAPIRAVEQAVAAGSATNSPSAPIPPASGSNRYRRRWIWLAAACIGAVAGAIWFGWFAPTRRLPVANQVDSIVVLPFIDMSEEKSDQPFCDGLTEELSNWLAQIPTLRVVARTSAFLFRGQHDTREIGKTLNATHVLEGSIRRSGDHMRITVQLIDARTGFHVWSSDFDPEVKDTIEMQESIARSVAENLQIPLTASTTQKFAERHGANPQAYKLYLFAARYRLERTRDSTLRAIDLYRQALSADPDFALAYVGLAYAYLNQHW